MEGCLIFVVLCVILFAVTSITTCIQTKNSTQVLDSVEISSLDSSEENLLTPSPVLESLPAGELKSKANELFNAYNEREHALAQAKGRLNRMLENKRCSENAYKNMDELIAALRTKNNELKTQYNALLTKAELGYAHDIADRESEPIQMQLDDADRLLKKHRAVTLVTGDDRQVLTTQAPEEEGKDAAKATADEPDPAANGEAPKPAGNPPAPAEDLLAAVLASDAGKVASLLAQGCPADACKGEKGKSMVHLAVEKNDMETLKALVAGGADVNRRDNIGRTPIYAAIRQRDAALVEYLISAGAETEVDDKWQITPREYAAECKCNKAILSALRKKRK